MALRVLLADESSTIKKAIQMALSDLGVDVKSVPSGLDVLTVARVFLPDLVLADVLLTKKNGYEVCHELKKDEQLGHTPVVLMWSSFMQLDQAQFKRVQADASLEKPFDSEALRQVIEKLVPKTTNSPLRGLLNHPEMPDFEESDTFIRQKSEFENSQEKTQMLKVKSSALSNQDALDELDDFAEMPLKPKQQPKQYPHRPRGKIEDINSENFDPENFDSNNFVVETESFGDYEEVTVTTSPPTGEPPSLQKRIQEQVDSYIGDSTLAKTRSELAGKTLSNRSLTNLEEQIMKEEFRMMAEKICWQILPEITEKVVREELNKLLRGLEKV